MNLPGSNKQTGEQPRPFTVEDFGGLDTKAKRPAIGPKDFYWIENFMPIGAGNMRTLYDREPTPIYTTTGGRTILEYAFYNLGSSRYAIVFLDNGTAVQVNTDTLAVTTISATANKFWTSGTTPAVAQWQAKYLVIASKVSADAYWIWDGSHLFGPGTLSPEVLMLNSGDSYTSTPTVTAYGGSGSGATFTPTIANGKLTEIAVNNPGSGYLIDELVTVVITGGGSNDQARLTATVTTASGGVASVTVTAGGSAYANPLVTFAGGGGAGAKAFVSGAANGVVTDVTVTDPGSGYTSAPTVTIADSGGGAGAGATALAEIRRGQITAITVNSGGTGYAGVPDILISDPNDFGFPNIQAEAIATVVAGVVTAVTLTNKGVGYKSASVQASGGNSSAEASVSLMPFGIKGTTIETYQTRVWVGDDTKFSYTGAASVTDFSGAGGGGSKPITDSFLREKLIHMEQANGFLYRFGDSSINVISNVQTSSSGVTTFNDSNVDPQIGTAWRDSVASFGRALVFANPTGVYALYGGAAEKVSSPLDGLFAAASFNTGQVGKTPTAGVATVFGIRCYFVLLTTTDPFTGTLRDLLCMWDGQRWFVHSPSLASETVSWQEINSILTGYAASTTAIHRLFHTASVNLPKIFSTKLVAPTSYIFSDQVTRVYFIAEDNSGSGGDVNIAIDTEQGSGASVARNVSRALTWTGLGGAEITWTGLGGADLFFTSRGLVVDGYDDSNYGQLIGATVRTSIPDLTFISMTLLLKDYAPNA